MQVIEVRPVNLVHLQQAAETRYHQIYESSHGALSNAWCSIQYFEEQKKVGAEFIAPNDERIMV